MANFTGMDIPAVRQLSSQMTQSAGQIRQLMSQLTNQLGSTQWVGPDRTRFESDWSGTYVQQLNQVATALEDAANRATQNANEQESASA
jgi:uncharacterized protein YukE